MVENPYVINFGTSSDVSLIPRDVVVDEVIDTFKSSLSVGLSIVLTGVRGSGKTVMLNQIVKTFKLDAEWIVIRLNPRRSLLEQLAAQLYDVPELYGLSNSAPKKTCHFSGVMN